MQDIGEYVDCSRDIGIEGFGIVDGILTLNWKINAASIKREK